MLDEISSDSKQTFVTFAFQDKPIEDTLITLLDDSDTPIFAFKTDRTYSNLIYSSASLKEGTYYLYKDGEVTGETNSGFYTSITNYTKGTQLGYSSNEIQNGMGMPGMNNNGTPPEKPDDSNMPNMNGGTPPEKPSNDNMQIPEGNMPNMSMGSPTNKEFTITTGKNRFSGIGTFIKE